MHMWSSFFNVNNYILVAFTRTISDRLFGFFRIETVSDKLFFQLLFIPKSKAFYLFSEFKL